MIKMKQKNRREFFNATFVIAVAAFVISLALVVVLTGLIIKVILNKALCYTLNMILLLE